MPSRPSRSGLAWKRISASSAAAELYTVNQQTSPLLRLPPELRQLIYEYILGGNVTILINYHSHIWKRNQIDGLPKWIQAVKGGFHCSVFQSGTDPFDYSAKSCWQSKLLSHGFTLLSGVCRQLYLETSTLPMAANTWAFTSQHVMARFLVKEKRLSLVQRRAVRAVFVEDADDRMYKESFRCLGNLQTVFVHGRPVYEIDPKVVTERDGKRKGKGNRVQRPRR